MDIAQDLILYKRILNGSSFNANKIYTKIIFLTSIWLSRGQLWAIIEGTFSLT